MNKRIRELLNEATVGLEPDLSPQRTVTLNELGKFAELIVKECVSIVAKRKNQAIDDDWNIDEAMSMAEMDLEEHFGVEE